MSLLSDSFRVSTASTPSTFQSIGVSSESGTRSCGGTPSVVRKRPLKPKIFLSLDNFRDDDYSSPNGKHLNINAPRRESDSSDDSDSYERTNSLDSDTSYLNVTAEEFSSASRNNSIEKSSPPQIEGITSVKNKTGNIPSVSEAHGVDAKSFIFDKTKLKPGSPTAELLAPVYDATCYDELQAAIDYIYDPISNSFSKVRDLEHDLKLLPVLQVKLAVLQEEKRQLMNMLKQRRTQRLLCSSMSDSSSPGHSGRSSPSFGFGSETDSVRLNSFISSTLDGQTVQAQTSPGLDKDHSSHSMERDFVDMGTQIIPLTDNASQQTETSSCENISTETNIICTKEAGVGSGRAEIFYKDEMCQQEQHIAEVGSQTTVMAMKDKCVMMGPAYSNLLSVESQAAPNVYDRGIGDSKAEISYVDRETQDTTERIDKETNCKPETGDKGEFVGCSVFELVDTSVGDHIIYHDFSCGEHEAYIVTSDEQVQVSPVMSDKMAWTDSVRMSDACVECSLLCNRETKTIGVGSDSIYETKTKRRTRNIGVGSYNTIGPNVHQCTIDDKLCDCVKPKTISIGTGHDSVRDIVCDKCQSKRTRTLGVGRDRIDDILCDRCLYVRMRSVGCGDDRVDDQLCVRCKRIGKCLSIGVGDEFAVPFQDDASKAEVKADGNSTAGDNGKRDSNLSASSEEELCREISDILAHETRERSLVCNYCGNKMHPADANTQNDQFESVRNEREGRGMTRTFASYNLERYSTNHSYAKEKNVIQRAVTPENSEEEEEPEVKKENDIIEICKQLQEHFMGRKVLKQNQVVGFMASIEGLWFKTIKRKRVKPAVVKGYIDLFASRIPELMQTIITLSDNDGNTAIHYALTYRNYSVVNILLDTNVCNVNIVNKAGYTPIMLAALVGFDHKKDKYVLQRLLSMGDVNAKSVETGQTPLMLAVTRGHFNMVELLADAGAEINAVDDDGSTALMCACEIGNINIVKSLLANPDCDATIEDNDGSTALSIAMDSRRKDLALLIYGSLNFDVRGRIKLSPSKQSLLGLGSRRSPSPVIGRT